MSNVVFILGAGASKQSGAPLMADFLDVAADLLRSNTVQDKRLAFERVFSAIGALQAVHSKAQLDLNNIESIFTVLELGRIIQRVPSLSAEDVVATIGALKDLIVKTLEVKMSFPLENGREIGIPRPYGHFGELLRHLRHDASPALSASVITFNYDIAADMAMYRHGLGPDYVLSQPPRHSQPMQLMKLHGSLNWASERETKRICPLHLIDYFSQYSYSGYGESSDVRVPIGSHLVKFFEQHSGTDVEPEPVIVPPSWNKADYHAALSDVWAAAARNLSEAEYIFIIGYSLPETDSFFRHLYALGSVGSAPLRRLAVFNPDTSGVTDSRFRALLGPGAVARYEYHAMPFDQAIGHIKREFPKRR